MSDDELIERFIELNPRRLWPGEARLRTYGVEVWALVGYYLQTAGHDVSIVAADYHLPEEAVVAALAYYRQHKADIDARLAANLTFVA